MKTSVHLLTALCVTMVGKYKNLFILLVCLVKREKQTTEAIKPDTW